MYCCGHIPPFSSEAGLKQVGVISQAIFARHYKGSVCFGQCFKGQILEESKHHSEQIHLGRCIPQYHRNKASPKYLAVKACNQSGDELITVQTRHAVFSVS